MHTHHGFGFTFGNFTTIIQDHQSVADPQDLAKVVFYHYHGKPFAIDTRHHIGQPVTALRMRLYILHNVFFRAFAGTFPMLLPPSLGETHRRILKNV